METIIKNEEENKVALAFLERLMEGDPEIGTDRSHLLSLLATEIQIFERRYDTPSKE